MPRRWTDDELVEAKVRMENLFTQQRKEEGPRSFQRLYEHLRPRVVEVFEATEDLRNLTGDFFLADPDAWQACRYVCGPPISQEDLWTLVGGSKFKRVPPGLAEATADALRVVIDPVRFGWIEAGRAPTDGERNAAILATTVLWTAQQLGTERRGEASSRQEGATSAVLAGAGLQLDPSRTQIMFLDDMARGTYSKERRIAGAKCDVPARLPDGRLLAVECKVSNGPKNGWKRVNREVVGKSETWRQHFGVSILTGLVLSGVFDVSSLRTAQQAGVALFWEHDLSSLTDFVESSS